jgi:hypothetical protein
VTVHASSTRETPHTVVTFTSRVVNHGPGRAKKVTFGELIDYNTERVLSFTTSSGSCKNPSGNAVLCSLGNRLRPLGDVRRSHVQLRVDDGRERECSRRAARPETEEQLGQGAGIRTSRSDAQSMPVMSPSVSRRCARRRSECATQNAAGEKPHAV